MTTTHAVLLATALLLGATSASADQFAIETSKVAEIGSQELLKTLHIEGVDSVDIAKRYFAIIQAPNEAYVEAYILAMDSHPVALYRLEADWNGTGISSLPLEARPNFMLTLACDSCLK